MNTKWKYTHDFSKLKIGMTLHKITGSEVVIDAIKKDDCGRDTFYCSGIAICTQYSTGHNMLTKAPIWAYEKEIYYPEHEKLEKVHYESQSIGNFLDWLQNERKLTICKLEENFFFPAHISIENLPAQYFEIDLSKLESEKREILKSLQNG